MENGKLLKGAVCCTYSTSQSRIRPSARDKDRNVLLQNLFCQSAAQVLGIVQIHICKGTWQGTSGGFVLMALTSTRCAWEPDLSGQRCEPTQLPETCKKGGRNMQLRMGWGEWNHGRGYNSSGATAPKPESSVEQRATFFSPP